MTGEHRPIFFDSQVHVHAEKGVLSGRWGGPAAESDVTGAVSGVGSAWPDCPVRRWRSTRELNSGNLYMFVVVF